MKVTIEIEDGLAARVKLLARKEKTTFRALAEEGLRLVLQKKGGEPKKRKWQPITRGGGFKEEFKNGSWETILDEITGNVAIKPDRMSFTISGDRQPANADLKIIY